jgi:hypothetical protein
MVATEHNRQLTSRWSGEPKPFLLRFKNTGRRSIWSLYRQASTLKRYLILPGVERLQSSGFVFQSQEDNSDRRGRVGRGDRSVTNANFS